MCNVNFWILFPFCAVWKEQPKVQGLAPRGGVCKCPGSPPGGFWSSDSLDCHSKLLETPKWPDHAYSTFQWGRWGQQQSWSSLVSAVWRSWCWGLWGCEEEEQQIRWLDWLITELLKRRWPGLQCWMYVHTVYTGQRKLKCADLCRHNCLSCTRK